MLKATVKPVFKFTKLFSVCKHKISIKIQIFAFFNTDCCFIKQLALKITNWCGRVYFSLLQNKSLVWVAEINRLSTL